MTDERKPLPGMKIGGARDNRSRAAVEIDYEYYQKFLDDPNATEEEKVALIDALWSICVAFVDLGYGIHPVQQASEQKNKSGQISVLDLADVIKSAPSPKREFDAKSGRDILAQGEGGCK